MAGLRTPAQSGSRPSRLIMGLAGLLLAYGLGSRAFDTGSWWQYFGTLLLLVLSGRLLRRALRRK
ncbi:MAG TPA: hypothetical protein VM124_02555 [Candidatus Limnocylindrales bacterium]|nr:hypothetical protein [Candidatus Limnocylindrales bacterium]